MSFISEFWNQGRKPFFLFFVFFLFILVTVPILTYTTYYKDLVSKDHLINSNNSGLILLDKDGKEFFTFNHPKDIVYVPISDIPISMQHAVVASEDKDFYNNSGFSPKGTLRALIADVTTHSLSQGGSTITQQLVKTSLLSSQKSFFRKYQEIVLATLITEKYSKQDILEMYLNSVYFGEGAFGIENAAETYFDEHASQLTLAQSTLLVSLLPQPSNLSPLSNNANKVKPFQKQVLEDMKDQGYITPSDATSAYNQTLMYNTIQADTNQLAPHFALMVRDYLYQKYGEDTVIRSGFKVTTTVNSTWQEYAENVVARQVANLSRDNATNGAAVVIDPKTGNIEALVGSHNWYDEENGKINMAITPRQPGSSFKPIIYARALSTHLITPATVLQDVPTTFPGNYQPKDFDGNYRGPVTVRRALANSLNIPAVEVMEQVGVESGIATAQQFGITTLTNPSQYGLSLVLGGGEVKLLDLTSVYAMFADNGTLHEPHMILSIEDKYHHPVDLPPETPLPVLDDGTAFLITSILSDNSARFEEFGNALTISRPAAVKTGTTEDFRDALTLGYTPSVVVGVWVGNNDNAPMDNVAGSLGAAPIWRQLIERFAADYPRETFTPPPSVVQLPSCTTTASGSARQTLEYFLADTSPTSNCSSFSISPQEITQPTIENPSPSLSPTDTPTPTLSPTTTNTFNTPTIINGTRPNEQ